MYRRCKDDNVGFCCQAMRTWPTAVVSLLMLSPILALIINASLSSAVVPQSMKHAIVTPILKICNADLNLLTNYRPISNISFVAKTTEHFVARRLQRFLDVNGRPPERLQTLSQCRDGVPLALLELPAAFDTTDHAVLLRRQHGYGISGEAHAWLTSYLQGRKSGQERIRIRIRINFICPNSKKHR